MSQLRDVNATDIRAAIELGCRTMQSVFNADDDGVPFFGSCVWPTPALSFSSWHGESHIPGRHLNALLNAENAAGIALDEQAIAHHRRAALLSYSGAVPLVMNRTAPVRETPVNFCPHNLREGFHALYALTAFRHDAQAQELAERSIAAIFDLWHPERGWDNASLEQQGVVYQECEGFIHGEARMLGPLVKYYRVTGSAAALELALMLKEKLVSEFYLEDGNYTLERFITTHTHSVTCVLSSLAQLADLLGDAALLERVKRFYDRGLWQMRDALGWSSEVTTSPGNRGRGEGNNSGDILETALILGKWGYAGCYHDAERILRCHLLPSQLRDISFIIDPPNPHGEDGLRDVADRHLGAWGFPAPYGHRQPAQEHVSFNMDIVGGVVGSLCEAYRHVACRDATGIRVNLLFDHETADVRVESPYRNDILRVTPRQPAPLWMRIPPWAESAVPSNTRRIGAYLYFATPPINQPIEISLPLPTQELVLAHPDRDIRVRLRGDAVVAMDNFGADWTFFESYEDNAHA